MPDECCVNCRSNYGNGPKETVFISSTTRKKIMILDSVGLDLWTEKAGNLQGTHAYVESILNHIITKQGLEENDVD